MLIPSGIITENIPEGSSAPVVGAQEHRTVAQIEMKNPGTQTITVTGKGKLFVNNCPINSVAEYLRNLEAANRNGTVRIIDKAFAVPGRGMTFKF